MTFGPELPPEEQARRMRIVARIGYVLVPGVFALVVALALAGLF